jgi:hypothetical protein
MAYSVHKPEVAAPKSRRATIDPIGDEANLDDWLPGEVRRLDFVALFAPEAKVGGFVAPHKAAQISEANTSQLDVAAFRCDLGIDKWYNYI